MPNLVVVGLAEVKWSTSEDDVLVAFSLGSCVGVALWDPVCRAGGLAHVVLPSVAGRKSLNGGDAGKTDAVDKPGKYADTAVPYLLRGLIGVGADPKRMKVYLAGGAHVLKGVDLPGGDVGTANVKAVRQSLKELGLGDPRQDVGEDYGRTMRLYIDKGRATVYTFMRGEKEI